MKKRSHALRRRYASAGHGVKKLCPVGSRPQVVLFPKTGFTVASAKAWARHEGLKFGDVDTEGKYIHLRQEDPAHFRRIRTKHLGGRGILLRVGWPVC